MRSHPAIEELVPHAGPMLLIGDVVEHAPERTRCRVEVAKSVLFRRADGRVPAWVGLEYMAQCVAAHGGLVARRLGERPRPGLFLGTRRVVVRADSFGWEDVLEVSARHLRGELGLVSFSCSLERSAREEPVLEGNLSVYVAERIEELARGLGPVS
jgi:predicted hotdog family 3-hydroxylacyl-ACP dehydratase